jgi:hypothetical protein
MQSENENKKTCVLILFLLVFVPETFDSPVCAQQIKLNSGTYLIYSGASIIMNGKVDNAGTIKNNGTSGFSVSGDLQNIRTFMAGTANHKIGGNFTNNGTFSGSGSTITFNGTTGQTIGDSSATIFNNLVIDNTAGVTLTSEVLTTISGDLTINGLAKFEIGPRIQLTVDGLFRVRQLLNYVVSI